MNVNIIFSWRFPIMAISCFFFVFFAKHFVPCFTLFIAKTQRKSKVRDEYSDYLLSYTKKIFHQCFSCSKCIFQFVIYNHTIKILLKS